MINLRIEEIQDAATRENFQKLEEIFKVFPLLKGEWRFITLTFTGAVTNYKYIHGLGFIPKDVIQTSKTGAGTLTWNYSSFNRTSIDITTTGACSVRAFIGSYKED